MHEDTDGELASSRASGKRGECAGEGIGDSEREITARRPRTPGIRAQRALVERTNRWRDFNGRLRH